jgi:hypothetical protein
MDQLRTEVGDAIAKEVKKGAPGWWRGDAQSWDQYLSQSVAEDMAYMEQIKDKDVDLDAAVAKMRKAIEERMEKEKSKKKSMDIVPYRSIIPRDTDTDLTYVGMVHSAHDKFDKKRQDTLPDQPADYLSRNPALDPPRPIPAALQALLDKEHQPEPPPSVSFGGRS